ncbi:MAG: hypothetical protein OHK0039_15310 [Bacteroidia bacterium]
MHRLAAPEGLIQSYNWYTYHDSRGYVWISSLSGLNRYDGSRARQYHASPGDTTALAEENVYSSFFEDSQANLWFSTPATIHCYLRAADAFRRYTLRDSLGQVVEGPYQVFYLERDSLLWVRAGDDKVYRMDIYRPEQRVAGIDVRRGVYYQVQADDAGHVRRLFIYGGRGLHVCEIDSGGRCDSVMRWFGQKIVRGLHVDAAGGVWVSVYDWGFGGWNPDSSAPPDTPLDLRNFSITPWKQDRLVLMDLSTKAVSVFDKADRRFHPLQLHLLTGEIGEIAGSFFRLYVDRDDHLWIMTENGGVYFAHLAKTKFGFYPKTPGANGFRNYTYWGGAEDSSGRIWLCAFREGVQVLRPDGQPDRIYRADASSPLSLPNNYIRDL